MEIFKLKLLIVSLSLFFFFSITATGQKVALELAGTENVIIRKDIPYKNSADSTLMMDVYYPPDFDFKSKIPAIVIIYGYTNNGQIKAMGKQFRSSSWYISWCKIIAASGIAAVNYETVDPENDLISLLNYINSSRDNLQIDNNNIGAYTCSANAPTAIANILNSSNSWFKCAVVYYGFFLTKDFKSLPQIDSLSQNMGFMTPRLSEPASWKKDVPIMIVRAGKDNVPFINQSLKYFYDDAIIQNLPVTLINYPDGYHGFDANNNNETTRIIIRSTLDFWKFNLKTQ
jgi:dienelactone hydrolase